MNKESFIEKVLGLDGVDWDAAETWRMDYQGWPAGDTAFWVFLLVLGIAGGMTWLYRKETRTRPTWARLTLMALRLLVLTGIVFMLLQPVLVFSHKEYIPSRLPVLVDTSRSMALHDAFLDNARAKALADSLDVEGGAEGLRQLDRRELASLGLKPAILEALALDGNRQVDLYTFDQHLVPVADDAWRTNAPAGDATRIGSALKQIYSRYKGTPLAGVLLVTDGQSNAGDPLEAVTELVRSEQTPIASLIAGTPDGPRNAKVTAVEVSPAIFVRDPANINVIVESQGIKEQETELVLEGRRGGRDWKELDRATILLDSAEPQVRVEFEYEATIPTRLELRATLSGVPNELTEDDNVGTAETRVVRQKIRVLLVSGSTFPEVQFLRNALLRDDHVLLSTWLMDATEDYEHPGDRPIRRMPTSLEELDEYDCVILYDPDPAAWLPVWPEMLAQFVSRSGGGLVYIAGERMTASLFDRAQDPAMGWLKLLPVVREPGLFRSEVAMKLSAREPWTLEITPEGLEDDIFSFDDDRVKNREILANLPGMFWHFPVTRAKPGATVLARHGDPRMRNQYGRHVLLATHLYGPGRTFFVGFDSTYRWRYLDEKHFDLFWARIVDRAGRNKQLGGRFPYTLTTDRLSYEPGSEVVLKARFTYPEDIDAGLDVMRGEWETGDRPPEPITLIPDDTGNGAFTVRFPVTETGKHFVRVWTGDLDPTRITRAATLTFDVTPPRLEYLALGNNRSLCESLAEASGGRVFDLEDADLIPEAFTLGKVERVLQQKEELWDAPMLWILILLCIFAEWVLRKTVRLI